MSATKTIGTTLRKTSGIPAYIADLTSVGNVKIKSAEIDVTTLDSTGGYKEIIPGLKDAGEIPLKGIPKSETSFSTMVALVDAQTLESWEITFPNGAKWFIQGYVMEWGTEEATVEGVKEMGGMIRISGKPVFAGTGISA